MSELKGRNLVAGAASGPLLVLDEPLSFWGGLDPETAEIIDRRHPQSGMRVAGSVLAMPSGRGSSSGSSVLAEAVRRGTAPVAILLREADEIVALGAIVAAELYGIACPVVVLGEGYDELRAGADVAVHLSGRVSLAGPAAG